MFAPWVEQAGRAYQMPQLTVTGRHHHHHHECVGNDDVADNESMKIFLVFGICALVAAAHHQHHHQHHQNHGVGNESND